MIYSYSIMPHCHIKVKMLNPFSKIFFIHVSCKLGNFCILKRIQKDMMLLQCFEFLLEWRFKMIVQSWLPQKKKFMVLPLVIIDFFFHDLLFMNSKCGAQMIYGPGPSTQGESKGPSRGGLWPKFNKIAFGYRRGQFSPRQTHSTPRGKGKNGIGSELRRKI